MINRKPQHFQTLPATGLSPRAHHTATVLTDGRVLIAGGLSAAGDVLNSAELFDSQSRTATPSQAKMRTGR